MKENTYKIITKKGRGKGSCVVIMCGVHGNEKAGIMVLNYLEENLEIQKGVVHLVYANLPAIEQNVRLVNKNLNRNFIRSNNIDTYEDRNAEIFMNLLDASDALIDLHAHNDPKEDGVCFGICGNDCFEITKKLPLDIIVSGLDNFQKGSSDGYMSNQSKPGICVELGSTEAPEDFLERGIESVYIFLSHFGCIKDKWESKENEQIYLQAYYIHKRKNEKFAFTRTYKTFDMVRKNEHIALDGSKEIIAEHEGFILFPRDKNPIGVEAFVLAQKL